MSQVYFVRKGRLFERKQALGFSLKQHGPKHVRRVFVRNACVNKLLKAKAGRVRSAQTISCRYLTFYAQCDNLIFGQSLFQLNGLKHKFYFYLACYPTVFSSRIIYACYDKQVFKY